MKVFKIWLDGNGHSICSFSVIGDSIGPENKRSANMVPQNSKIIKNGEKIVAFIPANAAILIEEIKP